MIVIVHSACRNYEQRNKIRKSWGTSKIPEKELNIVFLLARTTEKKDEHKVNIPTSFKRIFESYLKISRFKENQKNLMTLYKETLLMHIRI